MVLVLDAMRKCVPGSGGVCTPSCVVPTPAVTVPCGVRTRTIAPGTRSFFAASSTTDRKAFGSMVFRADAPGAEVTVVGVEDVDVEAVSAGAEHPAASTAAHAATAAMRCTIC